MSKTGLVLSGGGAKGAYHVGMMKALMEMRIEIDMISGASIGALNGGVLASARDLKTGVKNLEKLWKHLSENQPLQCRSMPELTGSSVKMFLPYLSLLVSSGLRSTPLLYGIACLCLKKLEWKSILPDQITHLLEDAEFKSILTDKPLQQLMNEYLNIEQLQQSTPLYVSVFKEEGLSGLVDVIKAELLGIDNKHSVFKHIQSLPIEQQKDMLLASAAIPFLFESRQDHDGVRFTDGGQGGWVKSQGNTPITPLVEAGCDYVIVNHLTSGSLWHRHDFPNTTCIEIRPNPKLDLGFEAMFDFSSEKIEQLKSAGYEDTMAHLTPIKETLDIFYNKRSAMEQLEKSMYDGKDIQSKLDHAMDRLRQTK